MKTLNSIKNSGRKALVGGLIGLAGLGIGCSKHIENRTLIHEELDNNYTVKYIQEDNRFGADCYQLIIEDSTGNQLIRLDNILKGDNYELNIKTKNRYCIIKSPKGMNKTKENQK